MTKDDYASLHLFFEEERHFSKSGKDLWML